MVPRPRIAKKLLIASVGVAAVSYVACNKPEPQPVGNLMPAPQMDAATFVPGNLMPPPAQPDAQPPTPTPAPDAGKKK